jgi:hypothetical protein
MATSLSSNFDGVEQQVGGAVPPGRLELQQHAAVGAEADAVLGQQRAHLARPARGGVARGVIQS